MESLLNDGLQLLSTWQEDLGDLARIAFAMLLAAVLGVERESANKPAGVRTHVIVAAASALFVLFGDPLYEQFAAEGNREYINSDPLRIIEAVITGVSFLCAGTIFRRGEDDIVKGLTTAASLLLSAGIGMSVAVDRPVLAIGVTLLGWLVLRPLRNVIPGQPSRDLSMKNSSDD